MSRGVAIACCRSWRLPTAATRTFDLLDLNRPILSQFLLTKSAPATDGANQSEGTNVRRSGETILYAGGDSVEGKIPRRECGNRVARASRISSWTTTGGLQRIASSACGTRCAALVRAVCTHRDASAWLEIQDARENYGCTLCEPTDRGTSVATLTVYVV